MTASSAPATAPLFLYIIDVIIAIYNFLVLILLIDTNIKNLIYLRKNNQRMDYSRILEIKCENSQYEGLLYITLKKKAMAMTDFEALFFRHLRQGDARAFLICSTNIIA